MDDVPGGEQIRRYPRMNAEFVVAYRPVEGAEEPTVTQTVSVGMGGIMFETESPLSVGDQYHIELLIDEQKIKAIGEVVHVSQGRSSFYECGFKFISITEKDQERLLEFYMRRNYDIELGKT